MSGMRNPTLIAGPVTCWYGYTAYTVYIPLRTARGALVRAGSGTQGAYG